MALSCVYTRSIPGRDGHDAIHHGLEKTRGERALDGIERLKRETMSPGRCRQKTHRQAEHVGEQMVQLQVKLVSQHEDRPESGGNPYLEQGQ
jgi:hypothetical protein